jgi:AraC family transcriptional activator of pobA
MPARQPATLPAFALYGEPGTDRVALLHVETIEARSQHHDWQIESHVHPGLHQLLWLRHGSVRARLDAEQVDAQGPVVLVIPPSVAHAFRFSPRAEGNVLTLDAQRLAEGDGADLGPALTQLFQTPRVLPVPAHETASLQALFDALHSESAGDDSSPVPAWLARCVVWRLAQRTRRNQAAGEPAREAHYTRWLVLVEAHYRAHWPVTRYAAQMGLSTERLNRLLRAETGRNAQTLLHERLLREACRRLVHVSAPVSRIGFELGFEDPAYFCRFFRRQAGCSPSRYRERAARGEATKAPPR